METLQRTANRGSISTGNYEIDNSLKFEADNSEFMARTNSSEGNKQICTLSMWVKRTELADAFYFTAGDTASPWFLLGFYQDKFYWTTTAGVSASGVMQTNRVFRDTSAWYHFVLAIDTTQGTNTNRYKLYVNGVQETSFGTANYPSQNANLQIMEDLPQDVGGYTSYFYSGYIAEFVAIDGQALAPTEFGEFDADSGIWKPIDVSGLTFGTNGFYLDFKDGSNLGNDASGGTDFSENNISAADQSTDTPTNNFATLNQLQLDGTVINNSATITEGATKATAKEFDIYNTFAPTFGVTSGKWYAEFEYEGSNVDNFVGILDIDAVVPYNSRLGKAGQWSVGLYQSTGTLFVTSDSGVTTTANWGATAADGDIMSVAVDMDNYFVYIAKNGTWQNSGNPTSGANGTGGKAFDSNKTVGIGCSAYGYNSNGIIFTNFGGYTAGTISSAETDDNGYGTFEYAPPSGYYALCTKNLAEYG